MRLRHIEVFHAIYTTGSITGAAGKLCVSQPAVSKVLQHAEVQLGFALFHRVKGKLVPTVEAEALIVEVNHIFKQINSLKKSAKNLREHVSGTINLSVLPAIGLDILPAAIKQFNEIHPKINFQLQTKHLDDVPHALFEYEIDIGLVFQPMEHPGLCEVDLGGGELVCVHSPGAFGSKQRLAFADLVGHRFISIENSGPLGDILGGQMQLLGEPLDTQISTQTSYIAKSLVGYGLGVAVVDEFTAYSEGPGITEVTHFEPPLEFLLKGLYLENRPLSKVCQEFLHCFSDVVAQVKDRRR